MKLAIKVEVIESEVGWGSKIDDYMICITKHDAEQFKKEFNSKNDLPTTPDWYMVAGNIQPIDITDNQMEYLLKSKDQRCWLSQLKNIS